ncbi:hypothetical protein VTK73DRAFT_5114 [Phialemonium thermophilum]|uniref:Palmitoyltransferase n=1 Tax=Phialemonium thermophilum TaxID=223376 RepID=A0ABR3WPZ8_9PEZI
MSAPSTHAPTRWITRIIPFVLAGCFGFATYVVIKRVCVDHFIRVRNRPSIAVGILVPYAVLLLLTLATYLRLNLVIIRDPGIVPLGAEGPQRRGRTRARRPKGGSPEDPEGRPYVPGPDPNPDSPGLERFYSKDVYVCETDGRPIYCSTCGTWKPDRAHHSREIDRCVRKMDHYCPWVGGIVSETSFKFFTQFNVYTALYCIVCLVACGLAVRSRKRHHLPLDGTMVAILALAGLFGLFTLGMAFTSLRFVIMNLTAVESRRGKNVVYQLAVRVPHGTEPPPGCGMLVYPLPTPTEGTNGRARTREPPSARDSLATRTFIIVRTEMGENPWDLGPYANWVSVMGRNLFDWLLPLRQSPCVRSETNESFYPMGPVYAKLRSRYKLPSLSGEAAEIGNGEPI